MQAILKPFSKRNIFHVGVTAHAWKVWASLETKMNVFQSLFQKQRDKTWNKPIVLKVIRLFCTAHRSAHVSRSVVLRLLSQNLFKLHSKKGFEQKIQMFFDILKREKSDMFNVDPVLSEKSNFDLEMTIFFKISHKQEWLITYLFYSIKLLLRM